MRGVLFELFRRRAPDLLRSRPPARSSKVIAKAMPAHRFNNKCLLFLIVPFAQLVFSDASESTPTWPLSQTNMSGCSQVWVNATLESAEEIINGAVDHHYEFTAVPASYQNRTYSFNARVLVVRLGKTGGLTMRHIFSQQRIPVDMVHVHPTPVAAVVSHPLIIVTMRDPISRFVASLNAWRESEVVAGRELPLLLRCFKTPNELVENSLIDAIPDGATARSNCVDTSRSIFQSLASGRQPPQQLSGHLWQGICFYLGGVLPLLPMKKVFIVTTETYSSDIVEMLAWLKSYGVHGEQSELSLEHAHASSHSNESTFLSSSARASLEARFAFEYKVLNAVLGMSVNKGKLRYCSASGAVIHSNGAGLDTACIPR